MIPKYKELIKYVTHKCHVAEIMSLQSLSDKGREIKPKFKAKLHKAETVYPLQDRAVTLHEVECKQGSSKDTTKGSGNATFSHKGKGSHLIRPGRNKVKYCFVCGEPGVTKLTCRSARERTIQKRMGIIPGR